MLGCLAQRLEPFPPQNAWKYKHLAQSNTLSVALSPTRFRVEIVFCDSETFTALPVILVGQSPRERSVVPTN